MSVLEGSTGVTPTQLAMTSTVAMNVPVTLAIEMLKISLQLVSNVKTSMNVQNNHMTVLPTPPVLTLLVLGTVLVTMVGLELVKIVLISMNVMPPSLVTLVSTTPCALIMMVHLIVFVLLDIVVLQLMRVKMVSARMLTNVSNPKTLI